MLMTLLEANGSRSYPPLLCKRVRDDVCWENSERPWRRSSFWLVLRVAIQRLTCGVFGSEVGHAHYKFLICILLSRMLRDSFKFSCPEVSNAIKAKLSRRLAKLEDDKIAVSANSRPAYELLFNELGPDFSRVLKEANEHISALWGAFKRGIKRHIPRLPSRAEGPDLQLQLLHSFPHIQETLGVFQTECHANSRRIQYATVGKLDVASVIPKTYQDLVNQHDAIAKLELDIENIDTLLPAVPGNQEELFGRLSSIIMSYLDISLSTYENFPEQMGNLILNVFVMWMRIDTCATETYPLLLEFHPGFKPELLDVLQLSRLQDMRRLQSVQLYLRQRCEHAKGTEMTMFSDPVEGCFPERYFDKPENLRRLMKLKNTIERASDSAKAEKERQYEQKRGQYDNLTRKMSLSSCTMKRLETGAHDIHGCTYCFYVRSRRKIKLAIHEDYLPKEEEPANSTYVKAIIFELAIPSLLKTYRDITWKLRLSLSYPNFVQNSVPPELLLKDYGPLNRYGTSDSFKTANFCLASFTKPFTTTHYKEVRFPTELSRLNYPHGLKYSYYDVDGKVWARNLPQKQTLGHFFQLSKGIEMPLTTFCSTSRFSPDYRGPTSNEIIANQNMCPPGHNVNEFTAFQSLFSGRERRWLAILVELGSSNLSFSSEHTMLLINRLAREAGPASVDDPLRAVHQIFRDNYFCEKLLNRVSQHLQGIASNWRESYYMNLLLTLTLRCYELGDDRVKASALTILKEIRRCTWKWLSMLQVELESVRETAAAYANSKYTLWAALLCRRTFGILISQFEELDKESIEIFIEATISMQANLVDFSDTRSKSLQSMFIDDVKLMPRIRDLIHRTVKGSPDSINSVINKFWPQPLGSSPRKFSYWHDLGASSHDWLAAEVNASEVSARQVVHFNFLQGHLLIDGKAIGRLPAAISDNITLRELFGDQKLRTFPSGMNGMTHMLAKPFDGHQVHIGFRDERLVVRACVFNETLELLDRHIFGEGNDLDLPEALVNGCTHWLNMKTLQVEIRRYPQVWGYGRSGNWNLDLRMRQAYRRNSTLVDPHGDLFKQVSSIFKHFEEGHRLTVFQPIYNNLTVEMKHLDLSFSVLPNGLLFSRHLGSEIDPNQDAGTFYGLLSAIVLRNRSNYHRRSIIVPQGPVRYKRRGIHIVSRVENQGSYSRYTIDDVLGRLCCPPEPRLLYTKALLHALTSFPVADDLTGLTGSEEALRCLRSGFCQPWTVLNHSILAILEQIGRLTPTRRYYPKQLKRQQFILWNADLTTSVQDERFRTAVEAIYAKVERLSVFSGSKVESLNLDVEHIPHLCLRSQWRRQQLERCEPCHELQACPSDVRYTARDRSPQDSASQNVFELVSLLRFKPTSFGTTSDLAGKLEGSPFVGGYESTFDKCLSASLGEDIVPLWGSIVNMCTNYQIDTHDIMFQVSPLAFTEKAEMELLRTLVAFRLFDDLNNMRLPSQSAFLEFKSYEYFSLSKLREIIRSYCRPFDPDHQNTYSLMNHRERKKVDKAKREYDQRCDDAVKEFAELVQSQWPCEKPTVESFESPYINLDEAMCSILVYWERIYQNLKLSRHIEDVQKILNRRQKGTRFVKPFVEDGQSLKIKRVSRQPQKRPVALRDVLSRIAPDTLTNIACRNNQTIENHSRADTREENIQTKPKAAKVQRSLEQDELETIVREFTASDCIIRRQYGVDLQRSLDSLRSTPEIPLIVNENLSLHSLTSEILALHKIVRNHITLLQNASERNNGQSRWLRPGGLWPCITQITLLEQLRSTAKANMPQRTKAAIVSIGVLITTLQRSLRLKDALGKNKISEFSREQSNHGHKNWQPSDFPDWLLFEIEGDLLIREEQVNVARATIWPESMSNSVLQMNMGQGCILRYKFGNR